MRALSSDQENPSIPPDAVRCLARISFAKVKYGLDSDTVRMNLPDRLAVRFVKLTGLALCLGKGIRFIPLPLVLKCGPIMSASDHIYPKQ